MRKIILLALLFIVTVAQSQIPRPLKNTYVNDFAHLLSKTQIKELNKRIFRIEKKSLVQFAVVLVNKLPAEYEIEDYSLLIARKWHVGKAKNGIVYVAVIQDHKQRLEVAKGMTDKLTEEKCAAILALIKPYFRQEDYYGGLQNLVNSVSETIDPSIQKQPVASTTTPTQAAPATQQVSKPAEENAGMFWLGVGAIVLFIYIIYKIWQRVNRRRINNQLQNFQNINPSAGYDASGYGNGSYYGGSQPNSGRSRLGSFLGGAAVGAAGGYFARAYQDRNRRQNNNIPDNFSSSSSDENNDTNYGNWGSGGDSSGGSDSSSSDSSSDSGFSGDGATSNW